MLFTRIPTESPRRDLSIRPANTWGQGVLGVSPLGRLFVTDGLPVEKRQAARARAVGDRNQRMHGLAASSFLIRDFLPPPILFSAHLQVTDDLSRRS